MVSKSGVKGLKLYFRKTLKTCHRVEKKGPREAQGLRHQVEVFCDYWGQTGGRDPDAGEERLRSGRELRSQEAGQKLAPHLQPASRARLRG